MSGWQGAQALHAEGGSAVAYTGMMDCLNRTVKEEGVRALFKVAPADLYIQPWHGSVICIGSPTCCVCWSCTAVFLSRLSMAVKRGRA